MTQEVDAEQYYSVGQSLFDDAKEMQEAFLIGVTELGDTGQMAGTDEAGTAWATSYDERVADVLAAVNDFNTAMENYGGVVIQVGHNHAIAEYNATPGNQGAPPAMPPLPTAMTPSLLAPTSAGGSGEGLFDSAIGLLEQVGVPVPNGDTEKLEKAAQAWDRLATVYQTTTVVEAIGVNARLFTDSKTPEDDYIANDLAELKAAGQAVLDGCAELAQSCRDYKTLLDDLRSEIEKLLWELAKELAVGAVIGVAASLVSMGVLGAVALTAKALKSIEKYGGLIRDAIALGKFAEKVRAGVKKFSDIPSVRRSLERLKTMGRRDKPTTTSSADAARFTRESVDDKLERYLLNPDHPNGGPKAKWFEQALGFTRENAEDLARQLVFDESAAIETGTTPHGTKFNQVIPITGANGKVIDVTVAWIRNNDGVVRLVTAIPTSR